MDRNTVIAEIKRNLERRSGRRWSVTGGRGTGWGWLTIHVPPKDRDANGNMTDDQRAHLALLLDLDQPVHHQGCSIPAGSDYYREYLDRSAGRPPAKIAQPYWD